MAWRFVVGAGAGVVDDAGFGTEVEVVTCPVGEIVPDCKSCESIAILIKFYHIS